MTMFYAGIGARSTPPDVLAQMKRIASRMERVGWILRSGGAQGADSAFASGTNCKHIYKACHASKASIELASKFHPAWHRCNDFVRKLHGRNMIILLGPALNQPVEHVYCWTPGGDVAGGTGQALRAAAEFGIPVYNLANYGESS